MIQAQHSVAIAAPIDDVWLYVKDIANWAGLFPGCQDCTVVDEDNSRWILKVGAGGMVRTVNVLVCVDRWEGPERVNFSFKLEKEPVVGRGSYIASSRGGRLTEITMGVSVEGSGQMAPMWEAVSKPLLPQLARSFADRLRAEIEQAAGVPPTVAVRKPSWIARMAGWWRNLFWAMRGSETEKISRAEGEIFMSEQNKAIVLKFIEAMGAGDRDTAATCLAPDAFTLAKGFGKFAGVREYDTILGTIEAFRQFFPAGLQIDTKSVIAEGDRVVVEFEGKATTVEGKAYDNQYCMVFRLADGKIKQVNEYFCTILADEVLWPLVERMSDQNPQG